jgi:pyruvate,orthophosphate dikinase
LLIKYFQYTYDYWLTGGDPQSWFAKEAAEIDSTHNFEAFFRNISHWQLHQWKRQIEAVQHQEDLDSAEVLERLLELPGFSQIVEEYRNIPSGLLKFGKKDGRGHHFKLIFLFHIINVTGLSLIHEEILRDINQTLTWIITNENFRNIQKLIRKTFSILKERAGTYPATAMNCVLNMGKGVYKTDEIDLVNFFIDLLIDLGFLMVLTMIGKLKSIAIIFSIFEPGWNSSS